MPFLRCRYGTWFGVEALAAGGDPNGTDRAALRRACDFLLSKQLPDGGWGESYLSCLTKEYAPPADGRSQVRNASTTPPTSLTKPAHFCLWHTLSGSQHGLGDPRARRGAVH